MFRSYRFLSTSLLLTLAACSTFSGDDEGPNDDSSNQPVPSDEQQQQQETDADGGVIQGSANVAFDLNVDSSKITLTHGQSTKIPFKIVRKKGFSDAVLVRVGGMPASLASAPVTVPAASDAGELDIVVASDLPQGPLTGLTIEASATDGRGKSSLPLDTFVRGAPGELDTTFGTNGFIEIASAANLTLGSAPDGRLYVGRSWTVQRYSADGVQDMAFGTNGDLKVCNVPSTTVKLGPNGIYWKSSFPGGGYQYVRVGKYSFDGLGDGAFGNNGVFASMSIEHTAVTALAFAPSGKVAAMGSLSSGFRVHWITATGTKDTLAGKAPDAYSTGSVPTALVDGAYVDEDTLVAIGTNRAIRLKQGSFDTTFGQGGVAAVAVNSVLSSMTIDGQGRYVLNGLAPSGNASYLVRLLPSGVVDPSLSGVVGGIPIVAAGGIKLDGSGRILQAATIDVNGAKRCALVRYDENGVRDASFGTDGVATPGVDGCDSQTVIVQADGRILVGGGDGQKVVRLWN